VSLVGEPVASELRNVAHRSGCPSGLAGILLAFAFWWLPANAESPTGTGKDPCKDDGTTRGLHILFENDLFSERLGIGKSDRWYTNGIKGMITLKEGCKPIWLYGELSTLIGWEPANKYDVRIGHTIGQLMFTPQDITNPTAQSSDRFWGGWLYAGTIIQRRPKDQTRELETFELDYGFVGRLSLAEQAQKLVHRTFNFDTPVGWHNQLRSEVAVQATYLRAVELKPVGNKTGLEGDLIGHYGFALGTLFDYANAGITARLGYGLSDAPVGSIEMPSLEGFSKRGDRAYVLARIDAKAVAHNTFIDGSLFRRDPHGSSVDRKPLVVQGTLGIVKEFEKSIVRRLAILFHRRTAEFHMPTGSASIQTFGTVFVEFSY
jgi:lipid A 3-O-deacylase